MGITAFQGRGGVASNVAVRGVMSKKMQILKMRQYLKSIGVNPDVYDLEAEIDATLDYAANLRRLQDRYGWKSGISSRQDGPLTREQKAILNYMAERGIGSIHFKGKHRFMIDFRENPDLARDIVKELKIPV